MQPFTELVFGSQRTRPGNFEGVGSLALDWLKRVKNETNILTTHRGC